MSYSDGMGVRTSTRPPAFGSVPRSGRNPREHGSRVLARRQRQPTQDEEQALCLRILPKAARQSWSQNTIHSTCCDSGAQNSSWGPPGGQRLLPEAPSEGLSDTRVGTSRLSASPGAFLRLRPVFEEPEPEEGVTVNTSSESARLPSAALIAQEGGGGCGPVGVCPGIAPGTSRQHPG